MLTGYSVPRQKRQSRTQRDRLDLSGKVLEEVRTRPGGGRKSFQGRARRADTIGSDS